MPGELRLTSDFGGGFGQAGMRKLLADQAVGLSRQMRRDVLQLVEVIVFVELGGLDQVLDGDCPFAGTQAAGK